MKNIYLILLLLLMVGCKEVKEPKIADSYELEIKGNATVFVRHLSFDSKPKVIVGLRGYKGERLTFDNNRTKVKFDVVAGGKKDSFYKFFIVSRKGVQEKLFGLIEVNATKEPQYNFREYVYLKQREKELYSSNRKSKIELTHSRDWVRVWDTCDGDMALKKDGSLWKFRKIGGCDFGSIYPSYKTNIVRKIHKYYLSPKKIADGFKNASIVSGGYRLYAIKPNGTLWRIQELEGNLTIKKVGNSNNWKSVGINITVHDGLGYDIGLKDDGSLWALYALSGKIEPLVKGKDWSSVIVTNARSIHAKKRDGTLWKIEHGKIKPLIKKDFYSEKSYLELLERFKKISSSTVQGDNPIDIPLGVEVEKDGTLKLFPHIIEHEYIDMQDRVEHSVYPAPSKPVRPIPRILN